MYYSRLLTHRRRKKADMTFKRRNQSVDMLSSIIAQAENAEFMTEPRKPRKVSFCMIGESNVCNMYRMIVRDRSDKWQVTKASNSDVMIRNDQPWLQERPGHNQIVNRYPNAIGRLGHKDVLHKIIQIGEHFAPESFDFIPRTFILPEDGLKFQNYQKIAGKHATFIAKTFNGSAGHDVKLFKELKDLQSMKHEEIVVQRYINNPYLINGLKFDFRIYVIVTGKTEGKMHAYVADEGIARFCSEQYQSPTQKNLDNPYMHVTNFNINKHSEKCVDDSTVKNVLRPNNATKRTLKALME